MNEIAKVLFPKYEDNIKTPDVGKIVHEIYDLETFKTRPEWHVIYDAVRQESIDLGIQLES